MEYQNNPADFSDVEKNIRDGLSELPSELKQHLDDLFFGFQMENKYRPYWEKRATDIYNNAILNHRSGSRWDDKNTESTLKDEDYKKLIGDVSSQIEVEMQNPDSYK